MIRQNLHMHCTWDDGRHTAEAMILASHAAGLDSVGLSIHCPMPFENDWACRPEDLPRFIREVRALKEKYAGRIGVYLGMEWDTQAPDADLSPYDYVIGSVHHLPLPGHPTVDDSAAVTARLIEDGFGGDADALAELYFAQYEKVASRPEVGVVGHLDLLTKFDEQRRFFCPQSERYRRAALRAMAQLVDAGKIIEVNTGAISRGYRTSPYPARELLLALQRMGGRVTVSADAHHTGGVVCAFEQAEALIRACGFRELWQMTDNGFVPEAL